MGHGIRKKVALVCAPAGGLDLAAEGCNVAICDEDESRLQGVREEVKKAGGQIKNAAYLLT